MSRDMLTSCGIQWLAQVARYFSQAHLYLNGTSWLTSVWPLMMRLSAALTRRVLAPAARRLRRVAASAARRGIDRHGGMHGISRGAMHGAETRQRLATSGVDEA